MTKEKKFLEKIKKGIKKRKFHADFKSKKKVKKMYQKKLLAKM
jgi:hypothetical protein